MERCARLVLALACAVNCSTAAAEPAENPDAVEVLAEVNRVRAAHGLAPVAADPALMDAAADYAAELTHREDFGHIGRDGSTPPTRAQKAGYEGGDVAENLAAGYSDADAAVEAWMQSPSHRSVILKENATVAGVAREDAPDTEYKSYWTMLLAAPDEDAKAPESEAAQPVRN